jgi:vacuolar protein sorting-associated protein 13A/C
LLLLSVFFSSQFIFSAPILQDNVENLKIADDLSCSALDEDDIQRVVFENKLGCEVYLKKLEDNESTIELLQHDDQISLLMPPARFSDKLNVLSDSTEARYYVVIQIFESKVILTLLSYALHMHLL